MVKRRQNCAQVQRCKVRNHLATRFHTRWARRLKVFFGRGMPEESGPAASHLPEAGERGFGVLL